MNRNAEGGALNNSALHFQVLQQAMTQVIRKS